MRWSVFPLFLIPFAGFAQGAPHALVWRVSGNGTEGASYLVGTVHSRDTRAFTHADRMLQAMRASDVVVGELDISAMKGQGATLGPALMMPPGKQLSDLYSKRKFKKVEAALKKALGPLMVMMVRFKPFYLMSLLSEEAMPADSSVILDQYLQEQATAMGHPVLGLESISEQMAAVDDITVQQQADMLYDMVAHDMYRNDMERMMKAYAAQDLDALAAISEKSAVPDGFNTRLLTDRNKVMVQRMDSLMHDGRSYFFALGAAHLPNADGLIALLRGKGFTVEPVLESTPAIGRKGDGKR